MLHDIQPPDDTRALERRLRARCVPLSPPPPLGSRDQKHPVPEQRREESAREFGAREEEGWRGLLAPERLGGHRRARGRGGGGKLFAPKLLLHTPIDLHVLMSRHSSRHSFDPYASTANCFVEALLDGEARCSHTQVAHTLLLTHTSFLLTHTSFSHTSCHIHVCPPPSPICPPPHVPHLRLHQRHSACFIVFFSIHGQGGLSSFKILSCVRAFVIEINRKLMTNPELLGTPEGYVAVMMPKPDEKHGLMQAITSQPQKHESGIYRKNGFVTCGKNGCVHHPSLIQKHTSL